MQATQNIRIKSLDPLVSPALVQDEYPITAKASETVTEGREAVANILSGKDQRLVVVVGPCSIHDTKAAMDYAARLKKLSDELSHELCIIMRVYFEKPRTTVGWKGLINDPLLDGSFKINQGLRTARKLLLEINELGMPTGSEFLDTIIPQYISDLTAWAAIGARTTESQIHRELASGLSMPVGFKNGTTGNVRIAVDAVFAGLREHHFLGVSPQGLASIVNSMGNPYCHVILRGSDKGPNYDQETIDSTTAHLKERKLMPRVMVDCSHGNSRKDHAQQITVLKNLCEQIAKGSDSIFGVMIESNITGGNQPLSDKTKLIYGQSITDACINWEETVDTLKMLADTVRKYRLKKD